MAIVKPRTPRMRPRKNQVSIDPFIIPAPGQSSVHVTDRTGKLEPYTGRAVHLMKSMSAIEATQTVPGFEAVQTYKGTSWYIPPIDRKLFLDAFSAYAYHAAACKKVGMYEAGNSYSIVDDITEMEDPAMVAWIDSLGYGGRTFIKTLRKVATEKRAFGDGFLEIISNPMGEPVKLRRMNPLYMFKKTESVGGGWAQVVSLGGGEYAVKHFRDFGVPAGMQEGDTEVKQFSMDHPLSDIYGIPSIVDAWSALVKLVFIDEYDQAFFKNSAVPQFAVILEGAIWDTTDQNKVLQFFQNNIKGATNAHRTLVMTTATPGASIKLVPLTTQAPDGSFTMLTETARAEILTADDIPPAKAGIIREGAMAGSSTEEQLVDFEMSNSFESLDIELFMNELAARKSGGKRTFSYHVVIASNVIAERQARTDSLDINSGARTINQVWKDRGREPFPEPEADIPLPLLTRQLSMFSDPNQNQDPNQGGNV